MAKVGRSREPGGAGDDPACVGAIEGPSTVADMDVERRELTLVDGLRGVRLVAPLVAGLLCLLSGAGCSLAPKSFAKMIHPSAIVRARAAGLADRQPDQVAVPALIDRLGDDDPVVRLTAHETLRERTGQNFGYLPWGDNAERAEAQARWKTWWEKQPHDDGVQDGLRDSTGPRRTVRGQSTTLASGRKAGLGRRRRLR
jgi:hypothetical protein